MIVLSLRPVMTRADDRGDPTRICGHLRSDLRPSACHMDFEMTSKNPLLSLIRLAQSTSMITV